MEAEICSVLDADERRKLWDLEKKLIGRFAAMEEDPDAVYHCHYH